MKILLFYIVALCCLTGCQEEAYDWRRDGVKLPTVIYVQADEQLETRALGDPGADPTIPLPVHLYLFISSPEGVIYFNYIALSTGGWSLEQYVSNGICIYKRNLDVILPQYTGSGTEGRLFAILSGEVLPQFSSYTNLGQLPLTLDQVKSLTFDRNSDFNQPINLRDLYGGCNEISTYNTNPTASVMCTHVAAKVDVRWNLRDVLTTNPDAKVRNFCVRNTPQYGYFFNDELANKDKVGHVLNSPSAGNSLYVVGTGLAADVLSPANAVYGRHDFYVFHPANNTIDWAIVVNDGEASPSNYRFEKSSVANHTTESAAYYRIDVHVDGLTNGTIE